MKKVSCDRCGNECYYQVGMGSIFTMSTSKVGDSDGFEGISLDLCNDCLRAVGKAVKSVLDAPIEVK